MDLDTSAKKFKFSKVYKLICIILCLFSMVSATGLITGVAMSYAYYDGSDIGNYTQSSDFRYIFIDDSHQIITYNYNKVLAGYIADELKAQKENVVAKVYEQYKNFKEKTSSNDNNDWEDYYGISEDISTYVKTTYGEFHFATTASEIEYSYYENSKYSDVESVIADFYDDFANDCYTDKNQSYCSLDGRHNIYYYVTIDSIDEPMSNCDNFNEESVYQKSVYFVCKNGELSYNGISSELAQSIYNYNFDNEKMAQDMQVYIYIDYAYDSLSDTNIFEYFENYDSYLGAKNFFDIATDCYINTSLYIIIAGIMVIISLVSGICYLSVAGKKSENQPAKLLLMDYIPFELHLAICGGIGFGISVLLVWLIDNLGNSTFGLATIIVYAFVIWVLLMGLSSSVARYAKSDKKFYKKFLTYYIVIFFVFIFKSISKGFKKLKIFIKKSAKNIYLAFSYKPAKLKNNFILLTVAWVIANIIAIVVLAFAWFIACDWCSIFIGIIASLLTLAYIVANTFVLIKFTDYLKQLDIIIDKASKHEEIDIDTESLPSSLKVLANSLKYTNIELQNAISKAIKDERLRTELITNVSHDLKTPLTSIINYVDLLSACDIQDEKAQKYIKVLDEKGAKLKRLIEDLIEASKVTSGNVSVNLAPINLSELCLQSTVEAQEDFDKAGLSLVVKQSEKPYTVIADGSKAFRIIENLLSNARKYSAVGSRVYVSVYDDEKYGIIEVKNVSAQPLDISPEELTERFVRGDKSRNMEGNGLGLSIAKELAKLQNGELEILIDGDLFKARVKLPKK